MTSALSLPYCCITFVVFLTDTETTQHVPSESQDAKEQKSVPGKVDFSFMPLCLNPFIK